MSDERQFFTVCFEGDIRSVRGNLFKVVSPFGKVAVIGVGNEFAARDQLAEALERLVGLIDGYSTTELRGLSEHDAMKQARAALANAKSHDHA